MPTTAEVFSVLSDPPSRLYTWTMARLNLAAGDDVREAARQSIARYVADVKAADTPQLGADTAHDRVAREVFARLRTVAEWFAPLSTQGPFSNDYRRFIIDYAISQRQTLADLSNDAFRAGEVLELLIPVAPIPASVPVIALTDDHNLILCHLLKRPTKCQTRNEVADTGRISDTKTVGRLLTQLESMRLVFRPHGPNKGRVLTELGIVYASAAASAVETPANMPTKLRPTV